VVNTAVAVIISSAVLLQAKPAPAPQVYPTDRVLTHREQAALVKGWIEERFDTLLPRLMQREKIDMWIIVSREYNDDPVFRSMAPLTTYSSRRRTILVFHERGGKVDRLSVGRFDYDGLYKVVPTGNDEQWAGLRKLVEERVPQVIGINTSQAWNHADGLTATEKENLTKALGPKYAARLRSAEMLAVGWLESKLPAETEAYRHAMKVAHRVIAEAFSSKVVKPGITTSDDLAWWMRQRVADMGLVYLGFSTDTQHNAYVLRPGETDAPAGLKAGLAAANRLQDLTMKHAKAGQTGNQALLAALRDAKAEGLTPSIYCHPIGYHGHAAGPPIGMTDYQQGVPVRGDYIFRPDTWHSIELNVRHPVPEWGNELVMFALEEDAALLERGWDWIDGRQTELYLIR
jgi:hypothetical protein